MQERTRFSEKELTLLRVCEFCGTNYTLEEAGEHFFSRPYNYRNSCAATCLACWLDCGPPADRGLTGNLLREFATKLGPDAHLIVMPVNRLMFSEPIEFQSGAKIYPKGIAISASEVRDEQRGLRVFILLPVVHDLCGQGDFFAGSYHSVHI